MKRRIAASWYFGAACLLGGLLVLAACAPSSGVSSSSSSSTSVSTAQATQVLSRVRQANLQHAQVSTHETLTTSNNKLTSKSSGEVQLKPTFASQLSTTSHATNHQVHTREVIQANTIYVQRNGESTWYAFSLPQATNRSSGTSTSTNAGSTTGALLPMISLQNLASLSSPQVVSSNEVLNGKPTYHIRGTGKQTINNPSAGSLNGQTISYTEDLWVDKANYQPYQVTFTAHLPMGKLDSTTSFSNWNSSNFTAITSPPASQVKQIGG